MFHMIETHCCFEPSFRRIKRSIMAIFTQQPAGQPMFVPPGVAPVAAPMPAMAAPGSVMYYPQMAGGAVIMVRHCVAIRRI